MKIASELSNAAEIARNEAQIAKNKAGRDVANVKIKMTELVRANSSLLAANALLTKTNNYLDSLIQEQSTNISRQAANISRFETERTREQSKFEETTRQLELLKSQAELRNTEIQTLIGKIEETESRIHTAEKNASEKNQQAEKAMILFEEAKNDSLSLMSANEKLIKDAEESEAASKSKLLECQTNMIQTEKKLRDSLAQTEAQLLDANAEIDKLKGKLVETDRLFDEKVRLFNGYKEKLRNRVKNELNTIAHEKNAIQEQNIKFYKELNLQVEEIKNLNKEREKLSNEALEKNKQLDDKLQSEMEMIDALSVIENEMKSKNADHAREMIEKRQIIADQKVEIDEKLKVIQDQNEQISRYKELLIRLQSAQEETNEKEMESIERDLRVINLLEDRADLAQSNDAIINAFDRDEATRIQTSANQVNQFVEKEAEKDEKHRGQSEQIHTPQSRPLVDPMKQRPKLGPLGPNRYRINSPPAKAAKQAAVASVTPLGISSQKDGSSGVSRSGEFTISPAIQHRSINVQSRHPTSNPLHLTRVKRINNPTSNPPLECPDGQVLDDWGVCVFGNSTLNQRDN